MNFLKYGAVAVIVIGLLSVLICAFRCKRPLRALIINAAAGIAALIAVKLTGRFTGISISINYITFLGSAGFGIPAVCGFLLLPLIFGV